MFKNFWFQTHWLVGITAGIILAVVGLTGGILSFETEIQDWLNRDVRRVEAGGAKSLSPAELLASVQQQLPGRQIQSVQVSSDPTVSARVSLAPERSPGGEAPRGGGGGRPRAETKYVNQYTGALIEGESNRGQGFFRGTRSLHRWLTVGDFGSQAVGKQLVGASTMLCVLLALSGLYLRWPRRLSDWRAWLTFDPSLKGRSFLWHLHAVLGTWVLVGFLLMSLTGLYWSYDWYRNGLYAISGVERPAPRGEGAGPAAAGNRARGEGELAGGGERGGGERRGREGNGASPPAISTTQLDHVWSAFLNETHKTGFTTATVNIPREAGRPVEIRYLDADPAHERANNTLSFDSGTGAVLSHERYDNKRTGEKFMSSIFPLHSGSFFGLPGLVLYMIASLAMPVFTITGWMLYLDRRRKKKAARAAESAALGGAKSSTKPAGQPVTEPLLLGFASQAGFARELAWQTAGSLQAAGIPVEVHPLERLDREKLGRASKALFVVSTFGEGEPPDDARSFERHMMREATSLSNLKFGVLALGDRQYKTFCEFGRRLAGWLNGQGARPLFPVVEVDKGDPKALEQWREQLGALANGASLAGWEERPFHVMKLVERRLLNPGSAGEPTYHVELEGSHAHTWVAGDIGEIEVGSPPVVREFSIASVAADGRIHLLIRQAIKSDGSIGIGSGWLTKHLPLQGEVRVRVRSNPAFHAPTDARPVILIGNGTGMAGIRSHLRQRALSGARRAWLIFGERNRAIDYYYNDEIARWQADGILERVDLAFSRDQADRIYVQHRLMENAALLREWIAEGAAIYVCGSAEGMAPDVDRTLVEILGSTTMEQLREAGRYRRDVY